jgi:hypothetical protein
LIDKPSDIKGGEKLVTGNSEKEILSPARSCSYTLKKADVKK